MGCLQYIHCSILAELASVALVPAALANCCTAAAAVVVVAAVAAAAAAVGELHAGVRMFARVGECSNTCCSSTVCSCCCCCQISLQQHKLRQHAQEEGIYFLQQQSNPDGRRLRARHPTRSQWGSPLQQQLQRINKRMPPEPQQQQQLQQHDRNHLLHLPIWRHAEHLVAAAAAAAAVAAAAATALQRSKNRCD